MPELIDPYLALDFAMNDRERAIYDDVLARYFRNRVGAKPADLLDELDSSDAYVGEVETIYEHLTTSPSLPLAGVDESKARRLIGPAIRLALILTRFPVDGSDLVDAEALTVDLVLRAVEVDVDAELDRQLEGGER